MKRQPISWEKLFANYISSEDLNLVMYKEFSKLSKKQRIKTKKSDWKMGKRHE